MKHFIHLLFFLCALTLATTSQAQHRKWSPQAKGAVIGAGSGAVLGAVINKRNRPVGAVVGGVIGGGVGYAYGKHIDNRNKRAAAARAAAARAEANRRAAQTAYRGYNVPQQGVMNASYTSQENALYDANGNPVAPEDVFVTRQKSW